jgi:DNA-binding NarL/FixJ family response regulator
MARIIVAGGPGATASAELIGRFATVTGVHPLLRLLAARQIDADLVVLHSESPAREVAALLGLRIPMPPILVVAHSRSLGEVVATLRAGAVSMLVEGQFNSADLVDAVQCTLNGQSRLSPGALTQVVRHVRQQEIPWRDRPDVPLLSRREREIMDLLAAGDSNAAIAGRLSLAEKTVRNQVSRIYKKLRVQNRAQATVTWLGRH